MVKKDFGGFYIHFYFVLLFSQTSYLKSKSRQNAANSIVAKSLPQKWVILPKSFV